MMLEKLIQHMKQFPGVWIEKPLELAKAALKVLA